MLFYWQNFPHSFISTSCCTLVLPVWSYLTTLVEGPKIIKHLWSQFLFFVVVVINRKGHVLVFVIIFGFCYIHGLFRYESDIVVPLQGIPSLFSDLSPLYEHPGKVCFNVLFIISDLMLGSTNELLFRLCSLNDFTPNMPSRNKECWIKLFNTF